MQGLRIASRKRVAGNLRLLGKMRPVQQYKRVVSNITPTSFSSLKGWYSGSTLMDGAYADNDPVTLWFDESGVSNDLNAGSINPIYKKNIVNGKSIVRCGSGKFLYRNAALVGLTSIANLTILAVYNRSGASANGQIASVNDGSAFFVEARNGPIGGTNDTKLTVVGGAGGSPLVDTTALLSTWDVAGVVYVGSTGNVKMYRNSVNLQSGTDTTGTPTYTSINVGCRGETLSFLGDIAEVCIFAAALTQTDITNLQRYFRDRYAL